MTAECAFGDCVANAMSSAKFVDLDDGTVAGTIPPCRGVLAFGATLMECQRLLRSTLEDWLLLGHRMGHAAPELGGLESQPTSGE